MSTHGAPIYLPAGMVEACRVPGVCPRHGRPATQYKKVTFYSRTPLWAILLIVIATFVALIVMLVIRKRIKSRAFPVCGECVARRQWMLLGTWISLAGFFFSFYLLGKVGRMTGDGAMLLTLFLLLGAPIIACCFAIASNWSNVLAADVTEDGYSLRLRKPAAAFVASLPPIASAPPVPPPGWMTVPPS